MWLVGRNGRLTRTEMPRLPEEEKLSLEEENTVSVVSCLQGLNTTDVDES